MPITKIDKQVLRVLEPAILAKLNETLGAEFGLAFKFSGGNFTATNAVLKLEVAVKNSDGSVNTRAAETFKRICGQFGLKPEHLGKTFTVQGTDYKITGLSPKRYKMPIDALRVRDGRGFKFPVESVLEKVEPGSRTVSRSSALSMLLGHAAPTPEERREVESRIAEMKADGPENYYADGEHQAAGLSERQIHDLHFNSILRQLRSGK